MNIQAAHPGLRFDGESPAVAVARWRDEFAARGAAVLGPPILDPALHASLAGGARRQCAHASWSLVAEGQPGEIAQDSLRAHLDPAARAFLADEATLDLLYEITGQRLEPSWSASCYTCYGPGQHMGEHCDKAEACRIAMLTYLDATWSPRAGPGTGLQLHVFRGDNAASELLVRITSLPGRIVVINGAQQAHLRPRLALDESLTMLAGCYRRAST